MFKGVIQLIVGFGLCLVFIFFVGPCMDRFEGVKPLVTFIEERNIDAGALYYTDIEEFSEANIHMDNTMEYMPGRISRKRE